MVIVFSVLVMKTLESIMVTNDFQTVIYQDFLTVAQN